MLKPYGPRLIGYDTGTEMIIMKIIGLVAIGLGGFVCVFNWLTIYLSRKQNRFVSAVPLVGAALLVFGLRQFAATSPFAWVGIVVDYGTLALVLALPKLVGELWSTSRINLVRSFVCRSSGRIVRIKLFKRGIFTIRGTYNPPIPCNPRGFLIDSFGFVGSWRQDGTDFILEDYADDRILRLRPDGDRFLSQETNYPENNEYPYDSLTMFTFEPGKT